MTDGELMARFEDGTLAPASFRHREHVRLTWLYLGRYGQAETERRLLSGLRELAARAGKPDKFSETLTRAWVGRIADAAASLPVGHLFPDLLTQRPDVLDARAPVQTI